ncbi:hypothetical protein PVAG01_03955 [Phlyctema vagabunda]|uniref:Uncharacterized protein n=1 Tax=Phlyctema vagabunda TaxID=108571 RepID=A0ABR4PMW4_9HELO
MHALAMCSGKHEGDHAATPSRASGGDGNSGNSSHHGSGEQDGDMDATQPVPPIDAPAAELQRQRRFNEAVSSELRRLKTLRDKESAREGKDPNRLSPSELYFEKISSGSRCAPPSSLRYSMTPDDLVASSSTAAVVQQSEQKHIGRVPTLEEYQVLDDTLRNCAPTI